MVPPGVVPLGLKSACVNVVSPGPGRTTDSEPCRLHPFLRCAVTSALNCSAASCIASRCTLSREPGPSSTGPDCRTRILYSTSAMAARYFRFLCAQHAERSAIHTVRSNTLRKTTRSPMIGCGSQGGQCCPSQGFSLIAYRGGVCHHGVCLWVCLRHRVRARSRARLPIVSKQWCHERAGAGWIIRN